MSNIRVLLANRGNPDFNQNPEIPMWGAPADYWANVDSVEEASKKVRNYIHEHDLGSGNWAGGDVFDDTEQIASISYNGKINNKGDEYYQVSKWRYSVS